MASKLATRAVQGRQVLNKLLRPQVAMFILDHRYTHAFTDTYNNFSSDISYFYLLHVSQIKGTNQQL